MNYVFVISPSNLDRQKRSDTTSNLALVKHTSAGPSHQILCSDWICWERAWNLSLQHTS